MEQLIKTTTAYLTVQRDTMRGTLSHAYLLWFADSKNLRDCLKLFALAIMGQTAQTPIGKRICNESFPDCHFYPEGDKKMTVEGISDLMEDCALRPLEADKKLYVLVGFEQASPVVQNKLLKILEEPPQNVVFLLGATATASILDTVRSRVKLLTIAPFSPAQIKEALQREYPKCPNAEEISQSCGGVLGVAQSMIGGGWFDEVHTAASEICLANTVSAVAELSQKYGDTKYKNELLAEMQRLYFLAYTSYAGVPCDELTKRIARLWKKPTLCFAESEVTRAVADVKFNAFFSGLLYDFMLRVMEENKRWLKL
jgi:hypothetical protein